ncbi:MAG: hypothetical protein AB1772_00225 [Candidatus Zixiibacteriota bacterium]
MKNCLTTVCVVCIGCAAFAADSPISKGSVSLGGQMFFQSLTDEAYENWRGDGLTTITLNPRIGGFVADGLSLGAETEFLWGSRGSYSETLFGIGPRIAYYFPTRKNRTEIKGSVYPYVAGLATFGSWSCDGGDDDLFIIKFGGELGALLMFGNSAGADVSLRVKRDVYDVGGHPAFGTNVQFGVGLTAFVL